MALPQLLLVSEDKFNHLSYESFETQSILGKSATDKSHILRNIASLKCQNQLPLISIFVLYTFLIFLFAFIGGILFHICEYEAENIQILRKRELYQQISVALNQMDPEYQTKLDQLLNMCDIPLYLDDNRWSLNKSVFFAFNTASTIGYGYATPATFWGRASTFFYGLPAIIIFGLAMIQIGKAIINRIDRGSSHCYITRCICFKYCSVQLQRTVCIFIVLLMLIALSASCMTLIEDHWSFSDGCYFMWISISTIGYGDLEPTVIHSSYWVNILVWFGLSLTAILIGSSQDYFQVKMKWWKAEKQLYKIRNEDSEKDDWE